VLTYLSVETATLVLAERCGCVADRLGSMAAQPGAQPWLARHAQAMRRFSNYWSADHDAHWPAIAGPAAPAAPAVAPPPVIAAPPAPAAPRPAPKPPDEARGRDVLLRFDTQRCIHARHCVLGEPEVFLANTPGEWLYPDQATPERIAIVAHTCPSGAVTYERLDGGPAEAAPLVNTVRLRENGPLAFHAEMALAAPPNGGSSLRATLCRCGQSANKPFCDGAHNAAGFKASGEPPTRESQPLAARNGPLRVDPLRNGPLEVSGNLELCAGTGRTVDRLTSTRLCRCGQSQNKPFCDNSHAVVGFVADGV
jgi:CDGSH-type Zn-finger protein/uncharacterized Fe-S cluster protein YjdI